MFNEEPVFFLPICSVNALGRWLRLAAKCELEMSTIQSVLKKTFLLDLLQLIIYRIALYKELSLNWIALIALLPEKYSQG